MELMELDRKEQLEELDGKGTFLFEQDQEHFKELDIEILEKLDRKELLEEMDRKGTYYFEVDGGACQSKEQDQEHFKEPDRKKLHEKLDRKDLLEELNRKGTNPLGVARGIYWSKEQDQEHFEELYRMELLRLRRRTHDPEHLPYSMEAVEQGNGSKCCWRPSMD